MYEDDTPRSGRTSQLSEGLIREVALTGRLRPELDPEVLGPFVRKLQRTYEGYAPRSSQDLLDWVKERVLIPENEWLHLLKAMADDGDVSETTLVEALEAKLFMVALPGTEERSIVAVESLGRVTRALKIELGQAGYFSLPGATGSPESATAPESLPKPPQHPEEGDELLQIAAEWLRYYG